VYALLLSYILLFTYLIGGRISVGPPVSDIQVMKYFISLQPAVNSVVQTNILSLLNSKGKFPCFKFVCKKETGEITEKLNFYAPSFTASVSVFITALLSYFGGGIEVFVLK
jgi:hypothetical protein